MEKQFKVSANSLRNFVEIGVPLIQILAVGFDIPIKELNLRIEKGEISFVAKRKSRFQKFIAWIKRK